MTKTNSGAPEAKIAGAAAPDITLMLDRSRDYAEVAGETEHNMGFVQDKLPFDKAGRLIVKMLTPEQKALVTRKITRIREAMEEAENAPVEDTGNTETEQQRIEDDPDSDVNLVLWAQGKVKYLPHVVYRVSRKRFSKRFNSLAEVKEWMIKEKVVEASTVVM
jgi:hypothetical protein